MDKEILSKTQIALLENLGQDHFLTEHFYLTGGTALAEFYLHHRYSEDLDFFSENEFDIFQADILFRTLQKKLQIKKLDYQQSYNRNLFFLHFKDEIIKVELTYFPFPRIEKGRKEYGIEIDSLLDLAANKLFSVYQRTYARDYIDLYMICKEQGFTVSELVQKAKIKFDWHIDPFQLGTQFTKVQEAKDYPRMIAEVSQEEWQKFFLAEAKKLKGDILE